MILCAEIRRTSEVLDKIQMYKFVSRDMIFIVIVKEGHKVWKSSANPNPSQLKATKKAKYTRNKVFLISD